MISAGDNFQHIFAKSRISK